MTMKSIIIAVIAVLSIASIGGKLSYKGRRTDFSNKPRSRSLQQGEKEGSYKIGRQGGEKGDIVIDPDDCEICSSNNKDKPEALRLRYVSNGKQSTQQPSDKSTCMAKTYPSPGNVTVKNYGTFYDLEDGDQLVIKPPNGFKAETFFEFDDGYECEFHTSCSYPIVAGDQHGPFEILQNDGETCVPKPKDDNCVICDSENKNRPNLLTFRYHSDGKNSNYQDESKATCRAGTYPENAEITSEAQAFEISDGDAFTLNSRQSTFDAFTYFTFTGNINCYIHTSCSVPLVVGDQVGPFEVIAGNECREDTPLPTVNPSGAPSVEPSDSPSRLPSVEPTITSSELPSIEPSNSPSGGPSVEPSDSPSAEPSDSPSAEPSYSPSGLPSVAPYDVPTALPSVSPSDNCITGNVRVVEGRAVIDVNFHYPHLGPAPSDWVGLYPCSDAELNPPFKREPDLWAYTCYDRVCRNDNAATATGIGGFTIDDETVPDFGSAGIFKTLEKIITEQPGCYIILLNRIDGISAPPYYGVCEGNQIDLVPGLLTPTPNPTPVNIPVEGSSPNLLTSAPTPHPTPNPTIGPTIEPTPRPTSGPTIEPTPNPTSVDIVVKASAPMTLSACDAIPLGGCSICGDGKYASDEDAVFSFPNQPDVPCRILEKAGLNGQIPMAQCQYLPGLLTFSQICECQDCA